MNHFEKHVRKALKIFHDGVDVENKLEKFRKSLPTKERVEVDRFMNWLENELWLHYTETDASTKH